MKVSVHHINWKHCWRVIPTRYPSEQLLSRIATEKDIPFVEKIDELTSTRFRLNRGEINFLPRAEWATGPGSQYIMASFSYSLYNKSRFSDGSYGVYYAAKELITAIQETKFHREKFLSYTAEGPLMLSMRVLDAGLDAHLHDIRPLKNTRPDLYSDKNYNQSQSWAQELWEQGSQGIIYKSVRHKEGECVAVFKPRLLTHCREERTLLYEWNGKKINKVYELQEFLNLA